MNLSQFIKTYRKSNNMTMQELAEKAGLSKGYISMLENDNNYRAEKKTIPSIEVLKKLSKAMNISFDEIMCAVDDEVSLTGEDIVVDNMTQKNKSMFTTPQEAFEYIIKQPTVAMFGGYDLEKMSDEEIIEFANDLADMIAIVSKKYKK
jgi:transcriptional regulator with XRE-family HTH domain